MTRVASASVHPHTRVGKACWASARAMQSSVRNDHRAPAGELNTATVARFFSQHLRTVAAAK